MRPSFKEILVFFHILQVFHTCQHPVFTYLHYQSPGLFGESEFISTNSDYQQDVSNNFVFHW